MTSSKLLKHAAMKKLLFLLFILFAVVALSFGQNETQSTQDTTAFTQQTTQPEQQSVQKQKQKRVYFGGNVGFSFGSYTRIGIYPLVGFKITPKLSIGLKIGYEYLKYNNSVDEYSTSNYGGSIFARYRIIPRLYVHVEYEATNYGLLDINSDVYRQWVNFLYLGGGYSQPIGGNAYLNLQVLFDVLNDENSPYNSWEPIFSVGVAVGF